jgi:hypothetical protein
MGPPMKWIVDGDASSKFYFQHLKHKNKSEDSHSSEP